MFVMLFRVTSNSYKMQPPRTSERRRGGLLARPVGELSILSAGRFGKGHILTIAVCRSRVHKHTFDRLFV